MNNDLATLIAPLGCYSQSRGQCMIQRETQAYVREQTVRTEHASRRNLVRVVLRSHRLTPDVDFVIRAHLALFDMRSAWQELGEDRRSAAVESLYHRIIVAASGQSNGTAPWFTAG